MMMLLGPLEKVLCRVEPDAVGGQVLSVL